MLIHKKKFFVFLFVLSLMAFSKVAFAHAPNQSYVYLLIYENSLKGRFEITTDDLNKAFDLDLKKGLTKEDVAPHLDKLQEYFLQKASIGSNKGEYKIRFTEPSILSGAGLADYVQLNFDLDGVTEIPENLIIRYEAFFKEIPNHRAMLAIEYNWRAGIHGNESIVSLVFSPDNTVQELPTSRSASVFLGFIAMIKLGIWHIWIGIDHILFLLALLLPSVLYLRSEDEDLLVESESARGFWRPVEKFKPALINVIKIVSCFTIAHTITLSLAALEIISLPTRFVESVIAISIALAALHNIRPLILKNEWVIAFGFGLFHGFGFAGVLAEKGFGGEFMALTLLGFNLGVEIGQIFIICLMFPALFFLRKTRAYPKILIFGSLLLIFISIYWFIERAFDTDLPLGGIILRFLGIL